MNLHFPLPKIRTIGDELTLSLAKNLHFSFLPSHFPSLPSRRGHHGGAEIARAVRRVRRVHHIGSTVRSNPPLLTKLNFFFCFLRQCLGVNFLDTETINVAAKTSRGRVRRGEVTSQEMTLATACLKRIISHSCPPAR